MKFFKAIASGAHRTVRASRQIVVIWFISILVLSLLMVPFRRALISYAGSSMATELLDSGFDISYFLDFSPGITHLFSSFSIGLILYLAISVLLNIFLSGGLFDNLRVNSCVYKLKDFFSASAKLFFPFLWVNVIVLMIILASIALIVVVPILIMRSIDSGDSSIQQFGKVIRFVIVFVILIYLLVADYARSWLAASERRSVFKAVGYGFKAVFTTFVSSYLFMLIAVAIQLLFTWLTFRIISSMNPENGGGLFLMFIICNVLIIFRIYLRAFRYGGVSALYSLG